MRKEIKKIDLNRKEIDDDDGSPGTVNDIY